MNRLSMKKKLFTVWVFFLTNFRRIFRDKTALFFTFLFPLIFLFVFGGISGNNNGVNFNVAIISDSSSQVYKDFAKTAKEDKVLKIDEDITTLDEAKEKMTRGQLDSTIYFPSDFGTIENGKPAGDVKIIFTQNTAQSGSAVQSYIQAAYLTPINNNITGVSPPFNVVADQLNEKSLSSFDYTFAGLLGFAILGAGIFGPINVFPELKKMGILRRLHTTPLRVWQYFLSVMMGNAVVGLMSLALMFVVAILFFHLKVAGNYFELALFLAFSIVMILGIGLAVGGWAKNERQAAPLANILVFPMMFLSGTFFPRFLMPAWLQGITAFFPLTPVIDGARLIATEGAHLTQIGSQLGIMAIWTVVIYFIAFRVFRWE
jgi:ABC-2 type transport system permease protein